MYNILVSKSKDIENIHRIHPDSHHHKIRFRLQFDHHKSKCIDYLNLIDTPVDRTNKPLECNYHIILRKKINRDHSHLMKLYCHRHIALIPLLSYHHRWVHIDYSNLIKLISIQYHRVNIYHNYNWGSVGNTEIDTNYIHHFDLDFHRHIIPKQSVAYPHTVIDRWSAHRDTNHQGINSIFHKHKPYIQTYIRRYIMSILNYCHHILLLKFWCYLHKSNHIDFLYLAYNHQYNCDIFLLYNQNIQINTKTGIGNTRQIKDSLSHHIVHLRQ